MTNGSAIEKVIVHEGNDSGDVFLPNDGEPMLVKISQVKIKPRSMTAEEIDAAKTHVNNTIGLADATLEISKAIVVVDYRNRLNALQGVGDIVKGVVKFIPGAPNPMVEKLQNLEKKIEKLGDKMSENFAEIKNFITEVKFSVKILSPVLVLNSCMADCFKFPGPEALQNFRSAYLENSPLQLTYALTSYLEQKVTNPLRMSMEDDKAKVVSKFKKWEDLIIRILKQLMIIEAFASGALNNKDEHNLDLLATRSGELIETIEEWKNEYQNDVSYWAEMKTFLEDYIPKHGHLGNQQKAKEIAAKLETYLTSDAFHVGVFNDCTKQRDYTYHCPNEETQMIGVWNESGCNAFIYRSSQGVRSEEIEVIRDQLMKCRNDTLTILYPGWLENVIQTQLVDTKLCRGDGLVFLIDNDKNPYFAVANCPERPDKGPGLWDGVVMHSNITTDDDGEDLTRKTLLISLP